MADRKAKAAKPKPKVAKPKEKTANPKPRVTKSKTQVAKPKPKVAKQELRLAKLTGGGTADEGQTVFLDLASKDGNEYRLAFPYQATGPIIAEFVTTARKGQKERAATIRVFDQPAGAEGSWLLKPRRVAIALTPDGSSVVLKFHITDGVQFDIGIQKDDVPKLQQALQTTMKRLEEAPNDAKE